MRFEVPQFIDVESKVVGPLTWKQFVYIAGGVGILVILYFSTPFLVFIALGLPLGGLSASLAFHQVNKRPLSIFIESVVNYLVKKKLYLWKREEMQTIIKHSDEYKSSAANLEFTNKKTIASLSHSLEIHNPRQE